MAPISKANAEHYHWHSIDGQACDGWHLVRTRELSVIEERMPAGAAERRHFHQGSRQFFYVLDGELTLELDGAEHVLSQGQGLEVAPGLAHQAFNRTASAVHFLVTSQPQSHGDRHDV